MDCLYIGTYIRCSWVLTNTSFSLTFLCILTTQLSSFPRGLMESSWGKEVVFVKMERGWNLEPAASKESAAAFTVHSKSLACQLLSLMHLHQTRQLGCQSTVQWKIPLASHKLDMELFSYSERRPGLPIFFVPTVVAGVGKSWRC